MSNKEFANGFVHEGKDRKFEIYVKSINWGYKVTDLQGNAIKEVHSDDTNEFLQNIDKWRDSPLQFLD